MKRLSLFIRGRVQGVLFRHSARIHAVKLGLTGFARNEEDGTLTIVAEGTEAKLREFLDWTTHGPPLARVDEISNEWHEATGEFSEFLVLSA